MIAIVCAIGANSAKESGNYALAREKARTALIWIICGGVVLGLIAFVFGFQWLWRFYCAAMSV